ncbi:hypothetical protein IBX73_07495 [candidate division WOR-3 bacterium]|nr:hypothetical protein [candidate division WOR-3 bacterium]
MGAQEFESLRENISRNIIEIKSIIKNSGSGDVLDRKAFDRSIYLFQSIVRLMINVGNNIIIEHNFRSPMNTADVFISLAEQNVVPLAAVRGMKRAALAMPKIKNITDAELIEIMAGCMDDFSQCLVSYAEFFEKQDRGEDT